MLEQDLDKASRRCEAHTCLKLKVLPIIVIIIYHHHDIIIIFVLIVVVFVVVVINAPILFFFLHAILAMPDTEDCMPRSRGSHFIPVLWAVYLIPVSKPCTIFTDRGRINFVRCALYTFF